jgi:hypothetical protein
MNHNNGLCILVSLKIWLEIPGDAAIHNNLDSWQVYSRRSVVQLLKSLRPRGAHLQPRLHCLRCPTSRHHVPQSPPFLHYQPRFRDAGLENPHLTTSLSIRPHSLLVLRHNQKNQHPRYRHFHRSRHLACHRQRLRVVIRHSVGLHRLPHQAHAEIPQDCIQTRCQRPRLHYVLL